MLADFNEKKDKEFCIGTNEFGFNVRHKEKSLVLVRSEVCTRYIIFKYFRSDSSIRGEWVIFSLEEKVL